MLRATGFMVTPDVEGPLSTQSDRSWRANSCYWICSLCLCACALFSLVGLLHWPLPAVWWSVAALFPSGLIRWLELRDRISWPF